MEWKDIIGYEGLYQISDMGYIRRYKKIMIRNDKGQFNGWDVSKDTFVEHFILKDGKGYSYTILIKDKKNNKRRVHRLVLETFTGINGETCDHIDNDKNNNKLTNLQWLSNGDNYRKNNSGDDHWTRRLGISDKHKKALHRIGPHSEETKKKISESRKLRYLKNNNLPL